MIMSWLLAFLLVVVIICMFICMCLCLMLFLCTFRIRIQVVCMLVCMHIGVYVYMYASISSYICIFTYCTDPYMYMHTNPPTQRGQGVSSQSVEVDLLSNVVLLLLFCFSKSVYEDQIDSI